MTHQVALYARVSTPNQAQAQTIEQQLERLHAHVQAQAWSLAEEHIFRDDGRSGSTLKRPGLDRLRDAVRLGAVDLILVTSPDRLARNYVHQMVLLEELARMGCQVEFLDRPMSQDPHDQLLLQIRSAVAEYERTLITDRMRRGRLAKYRAGVLLPWTRPPYGYRVDPERPRDPAGVRMDESEAAVVREIFAWYAQEKSSLLSLARHIQALGVPTPSGKKLWGLATLRAILRQLAYTGKVYACRARYRPARIRRSATHPIGTPHETAEELPPEEWIFVALIPALISAEQFELVQMKLAKNKSFATRNNTRHPYLLRALVSCGLCQAACTARAVGEGRLRYYVCSGKDKPVHSRRETKCPSRFAPAQALEDLVWQDLCAVLTHPESLTPALERAHGGAWLPQELHMRRENMRRSQLQLEKQLERLTEAYLATVIPLPEYQRHRQALEKKVQSLENQAAQLTAQVDRQNELAGLVQRVEDFCQRVQVGLEQATFEQKRTLVELLIDRVIFTEGEVEIRYVIPTAPESETIRFCHLRSDYRHYLRALGTWMPGAAGSAAGRWPPICARTWCWMPCRWLFVNGSPKRSFITPIRVVRMLRIRHIPLWHSGTAVAKRASCPRWARSATVMTMHSARVSLPRWKVNSWTGSLSVPFKKRTRPSSCSSKAGTIPSAATHLLTTCRRSITNEPLHKY
jgi:site-specific DNA recombinase